jgi:3-oxoacyl-[acyl-carrier protein] reductase
MELHLGQKRVLITGSSRGIGYEIGNAFLGERADVVFSSRNQNDLSRIKYDLEKKFRYNSILAIQCDFTKQKDIIKLREQICEQWSGLDILVCNVGGGKSLDRPIPEKEDFSRLLSLNFHSAVDTTREFLTLLKQSQGCILFISSIVGVESFNSSIDYSVAKTALIAFSKNLARKVASHRIRVNCLVPGNVLCKGGIWERRLKMNPAKYKEIIRKEIPLCRLGKPEDIANACLFLCSEQAAYITGATLVVDGGNTVAYF